MNEILSIIISSTICSSILILLNKTDFIYEYLKFCPMPKIWQFYLLLTPYKSEKSNYSNILFYWNEKFSEKTIISFFLKLITCPFCFGVWLSFIVNLIIGNYFVLIAPTYIFALIWYFLIDFLSKSK